MTAKIGLIRRVWTPLNVGFPSCPAANGADKPNNDEDEQDYNTMFSTRSELVTIAAIENLAEIEYVQARVQRVAKLVQTKRHDFMPR